MIRILCVLCPLLVSSALAADESSAAPSRSPADMTVQQRVEMMEAANAYNACVYRQAIENIDVDGDIRRIADLALGSCQPQLDDLDDTITNWGFAQNFAEQFTRNVRNRATRKLLPELAVRKSN
jgi:hypothetical protein